MTAHIILLDLSRKSLAMACCRIKGKHCCQTVTEAITAVLEEWHIHWKTVSTVTDNATNFNKAFRVMAPSRVRLAAGLRRRPIHWMSILDLRPTRMMRMMTRSRRSMWKKSFTAATLMSQARWSSPCTSGARPIP